MKLLKDYFHPVLTEDHSEGLISSLPPFEWLEKNGLQALDVNAGLTDTLTSIVLNPDLHFTNFFFSRLFSSHANSFEFAETTDGEVAQSRFFDRFGFKTDDTEGWMNFLVQTWARYPSLTFLSTPEQIIEWESKHEPVEQMPLLRRLITPARGSLISRMSILKSPKDLESVFNKGMLTELLFALCVSGHQPQKYILTRMIESHGNTIRILEADRSSTSDEFNSLLLKLGGDVSTKEGVTRALRKLCSYHPTILRLLTFQIFKSHG